MKANNLNKARSPISTGPHKTQALDKIVELAASQPINCAAMQGDNAVIHQHPHKRLVLLLALHHLEVRLAAIGTAQTAEYPSVCLSEQ
jgi:hypothetical protein